MNKDILTSVSIASGAPTDINGHHIDYIGLRAAEASSRPSRITILNAGAKEAWFRRVHCEAAWINEIGLFMIEDVTVSGYGYVFIGKDFLLDGSEPSRVGLQFALAENLNVEVLLRRKEAIVIQKPVLIVFGPGHLIWGHWLLDFFPRIGVAQSILGRGLDGKKLLLPDDTPQWVYHVLDFAFGIPRSAILTFDRRRQSVRCTQAFLPTYCHNNYFFHSINAELWAPLIRTVPVDAPAYVFVSRREFRTRSASLARVFEQEDLFEQAAVEAGFTVVQPELLSFRQQIDLFAQASIIAGEYGSGLHSTIFSPRSTVVGAMNFPNSTQSRIASFRGQHVVFLLPDSDVPDERGVRRISTVPSKIRLFFETLRDIGC